MIGIISAGLAWVLDLILGDPYTWPHPVKVIGNYISFFQKKWLSQTDLTAKQKKIRGGLLFITTVGLTAIVTWLVIWLAGFIHRGVQIAVIVYLSYTTLATKSLAVEGEKIYQTLTTGSLEDARQQVGMIVGRETSQLTEEEIIHATIETVAENTADGVVAPLFFLLIGGPVLAMSYKAVNTLDSMVGYVTPKYKEVGLVSAKMDDWWNFIPARLTMVFMIIGSWLLRLNSRQALKIGWRDRLNHKSPNSGYSEAVAAGALGIQLGGSHVYHGIEVSKPFIGDDLRPADAKDIIRMNHLLFVTSLVSLVCLSALKWLWIMR